MINQMHQPGIEYGSVGYSTTGQPVLGILGFYAPILVSSSQITLNPMHSEQGTFVSVETYVVPEVKPNF
jgi:hypothetical protein